MKQIATSSTSGCHNNWHNLSLTTE